MEVLKSKLMVGSNTVNTGNTAGGQTVNRNSNSLHQSLNSYKKSYSILGLLKKNASSFSTWRLMKQIYSAEGLLGFWRGYWISLLVFVPYTVM